MSEAACGKGGGTPHVGMVGSLAKVADGIIRGRTFIDTVPGGSRSDTRFLTIEVVDVVVD